MKKNIIITFLFIASIQLSAQENLAEKKQFIIEAVEVSYQFGRVNTSTLSVYDYQQHIHINQLYNDGIPAEMLKQDGSNKSLGDLYNTTSVSLQIKKQNNSISKKLEMKGLLGVSLGNISLGFREIMHTSKFSELSFGNGIFTVPYDSTNNYRAGVTQNAKLFQITSGVLFEKSVSKRLLFSTGLVVNFGLQYDKQIGVSYSYNNKLTLKGDFSNSNERNDFTRSQTDYYYENVPMRNAFTSSAAGLVGLRLNLNSQPEQAKGMWLKADVRGGAAYFAMPEFESILTPLVQLNFGIIYCF